MNLAQLIEAENTRPGPVCSIARILDALSPKDRDALAAALTNNGITSAAIGRALAKANLGLLNHATIRRHRSGECACGPR